MASTVRFSTFPRTEPPPEFAWSLIDVFRRHDHEISTVQLQKALTSDAVLAVLADDLVGLGFDVELGKSAHERIDRPVFYGENGEPTLKYEIDAFHEQWACGLEVEAGRAWMENAIYRDLVQASVMVGVNVLCLAVSNEYKYGSGGKAMISRDNGKTVQVADAIFGHSRLPIPYSLIVIGY